MPAPCACSSYIYVSCKMLVFVHAVLLWVLKQVPTKTVFVPSAERELLCPTSLLFKLNKLCTVLCAKKACAITMRTATRRIRSPRLHIHWCAAERIQYSVTGQDQEGVRAMPTWEIEHLIFLPRLLSGGEYSEFRPFCLGPPGPV